VSSHAALEVATHLLGFIGFDGAGVRLFLGDADRLESVENCVALLFQLARQIVDSNFTHVFPFVLGGCPPAVCSPAHLAVHISLNRSRSWFKGIILRNR
jgi:hypothetical protein